MITQNFIMEFEMSLLRSFALAARRSGNQKIEQNFAGIVKQQDFFMKAFMEAFEQKRKILEQEIVIGGNRDAGKLVDQIQRLVEMKLQTLLCKKEGKADELAFKKAVRELKTEVRSIFYNEVSLKCREIL